MAAEKLGLEIAVLGFAKFMSDMKSADKAISGSAGAWKKAGAEAGKASREVSLLQRDMGKLASSAESTLRAMQPLGLAFSALSAAGGALITSSTMIAARNEELAVVLQTVGTNAGYTEAQLATYEAGVKSMGITTSSARQSLVQMAQAGLDMANAMDLARLAQDAAVIANVDSSEAFQRLITIIQTGNVLMGRRLGLTLDFNAANKRMAAELGITTDQLTQQQRVQARMNEVMRQGANIAGTYEAAMTTAGKQMRSLSRHWEEARAALGEAFLPALSAVVKALTKMLKAFNDLTPGAKRTTAGILAVTTAVTGLLGAVILLTPRIIQFATALGPLVTLTGEVAAGLQLLAGGATFAEVASLGLAGSLASLGIALSALTIMMGAFYIAVSNMEQTEREAAQSMDLMADASAMLEGDIDTLTGATQSTRYEMEFLHEVADQVTDSWMFMRGAADEATIAMAQSADAAMLNSVEMWKTKEAADAAAGGLGGTAEASRDAARAFGEMVFDEQTLWNLALASGASTEALAALAEHLGIATEAEIANTLAAYDLVEAFEQGLITEQELADGFHDLATATDVARVAAAKEEGAIESMAGGMQEGAGAARDLTGDIENTTGALDDGAMSAGTYGDRLRSIPSSITTTITSIYRSVYEEGGGTSPTGGGAAEGYQRGTPFVPRTGRAFLHRGEAVLPVPMAQQFRQSIANNATTNNFNLTTNSITRPGGLAAEFGTMQMATR